MSDLLELFPAGSDTDPDGMLTVGGCRADDLAAEFGTPVLVVAESALRARAREYADELARRWPKSRVVFASKAFPCTAVQRVMVEEGLGLDVAGGGEILTALKAGVDPSLVVLHGNAKSTEEIAMAVENGIGLVVVDGPDDVDRLEAIVPSGRAQDVLVRIIPGVTADTHAHVLTGHEGSKFGLLPAAAAELITRIEHSPRLRMRGVHVARRDRRSWTPSRSPSPSRRWPRSASSRSTTWAVVSAPGTPGPTGRRPSREYLDVADRRGPRAPAGARRRSSSSPAAAWSRRPPTTIYRVTTVKRGPTTFVAVDGGMGDNLEVALFGQRFEAGIADRLDAAGGEPVTVVGRHCESGDVLVDGVPLDAPRVGDLLAVPATGAYCFTMANNYNGNRRIPVVFARDGAARGSSCAARPGRT